MVEIVEQRLVLLRVFIGGAGGLALVRGSAHLEADDGLVLAAGVVLRTQVLQSDLGRLVHVGGLIRLL